MKTSFYRSFKLLFAVLAICSLAIACRRAEPLAPPDDNPALTIEEDLKNQGYEQEFLWTLLDAKKAPFELNGLQVEISGPDSQWGTATPGFLLSFSTDQGRTWQDSLLVFKKPPIYVNRYAFYYQDNKVINNKDMGTIAVYKKP